MTNFHTVLLSQEQIISTVAGLEYLMERFRNKSNEKEFKMMEESHKILMMSLGVEV